MRIIDLSVPLESGIASDPPGLAGAAQPGGSLHHQ
jgi:hypothetical protein